MRNTKRDVMSKNMIARTTVIAVLVGFIVLAVAIVFAGFGRTAESGDSAHTTTEQIVSDSKENTQTKTGHDEATDEATAAADAQATKQKQSEDDQSNSSGEDYVAGKQGQGIRAAQATQPKPEYDAMQDESSTAEASYEETIPTDDSGWESNGCDNGLSEDNAVPESSDSQADIAQPEPTNPVDHGPEETVPIEQDNPGKDEDTQVTDPNVEAPSSGSLTSAQRNAIVTAAYGQLGLPYGHENKPGVNWDAAGLVAYAYACAGIQVSTFSYDQIASIQNTNTLQPGDVIGWLGNVPGGAYDRHVALYIGGGMILHADGRRVGVESLSAWSPYTNGGPLV